MFVLVLGRFGFVCGFFLGFCVFFGFGWGFSCSSEVGTLKQIVWNTDMCKQPISQSGYFLWTSLPIRRNEKHTENLLR